VLLHRTRRRAGRRGRRSQRAFERATFPAPRGWRRTAKQVSWLPDLPTPGPSRVSNPLGDPPHAVASSGFVPGYSGGGRAGFTPASLWPARFGVRALAASLPSRSRRRHLTVGFVKKSPPRRRARNESGPITAAGGGVARRLAEQAEQHGDLGPPARGAPACQPACGRVSGLAERPNRRPAAPPGRPAAVAAAAKPAAPGPRR
jgi:hypothetical protein